MRHSTRIPAELAVALTHVSCRSLPAAVVCVGVVLASSEDVTVDLADELREANASVNVERVNAKETAKATRLRAKPKRTGKNFISC